MALNASQVKDVWHDFVSTLGATACPFTKADLAAAVAAADSWCTSNAAAYNGALPDPFKSSATAAQKSQLLALVALKRYSG